MKLSNSMQLVLLLALSSQAMAAEGVQTLVAFGDSTTEARRVSSSYPRLLQEELPENGLAVHVVNAGVGGHNTNQARARFAADVLSKRPDIVVIQFGINDAAVDVWKNPPASKPRVNLEAYAENLEFFVSSLKSQHAQVILMTPNPLRWTPQLRQLYGKPPYQPAETKGFNVVLTRYAQTVRDIANSESVPLVDVYALFEQFGTQGGQSVSDLLRDGMHPNERGHRLVADQLISLLAPARESQSLIASISKETLFRNRDGGGRTWFHPRACMLPGPDGKPVALMNLQEIGGSDYFGQVHWTMSSDLGKTWSDPQPIAALGRDPVPGRSDGLQAAVCDVTPQYHPQTGAVIALGHVVYYKGDYFARKEQLRRYPIYVTRAPDGTWSERKVLEWDDPRGAHIYTNNCGQRVMLANGGVQMSFSFGPHQEQRMVAGVRATFDGQHLKVRHVGPPLENPRGRGLLEPSVARFQGKFWMTMRAEDNRGYVSTSDDGLNWEEQRAWTWQDGIPVEMSTTQQHWLTHSDGLFLVYTRKDPANVSVIRWRSPLWVAQVDVHRRCLIKSTEQIVLPLVGDGVNDADRVALMGNFHVTNASPHESWVTVGEWLPRHGYRGDVLLGRIRWSRPNRLPLW